MCVCIHTSGAASISYTIHFDSSMHTRSAARDTGGSSAAMSRAKAFETGDVLHIIMSFCATSHMVQMNQIAVANRRLNIFWRKMHYALSRRMLRSIADMMGKFEPTGAFNVLVLIFQDFQDIHSFESDDDTDTEEEAEDLLFIRALRGQQWGF